MLSQIPTHLIAGPLGAGKTSLLRALLAQRPAEERWAILINEFGQIGLDQALLSANADDAVSLSEIPGGCLCCVNGVPFQVGLTRLLRKARPDRLWIECSGLGHPVSLLQQLADAPWRGVLDLKPLIMVCEASQLLDLDSLPPVQRQALPLTGLLIANKIDELGAQQQQILRTQWPDAIPCSHGKVERQLLPGATTPGQQPVLAALPAAADAGISGRLWQANDPWQCESQLNQTPYSVGWRIAPQQQFEQAALRRWLAEQSVLRAKGVIHTDVGWCSFNQLGQPDTNWQPSPWRRDNRLELLFAHKPDTSALEQGLRACLRSQ